MKKSVKLIAQAGLIVGFTALFVANSVKNTLRADPPMGKMTVPVVAGTPVVLPDGKGGFDWMATDAPLGRIYAAHKGAGTLVVFDAKTRKVLATPKAGEVQGIAVDVKDNKIFGGAAGEMTVTVIDRQTLKPVSSIKMTGEIDAMTFDSKRGRVYVDKDNGPDVWVIDAKTEKIVATINVGGAPEYVQYDPITDRVYQNIKDTNSTVVINPETNTIEATWKTDPLTSPHGLAIDEKAGRVFVAGAGNAAMMDRATGKVMSHVAITPGYVDQIAFDSKRQMLYCASRGKLGVVAVKGDTLKWMGELPTLGGAHTLAVDEKTGTVWVAYGVGDKAYLAPFSPKK